MPANPPLSPEEAQLFRSAIGAMAQVYTIGYMLAEGTSMEERQTMGAEAVKHFLKTIDEVLPDDE
jgi:hypothetical protein